MTGADGGRPAPGADHGGTNGPEAEDKAWVRVTTPLSPPALCHFIADIERLLRINPMLEVESFQHLGGGHYCVRTLNLSTGMRLETTLHATAGEGRVELVYAQGLKRRTLIEVEADGAGSALRITDDYSGTPEAERRARLGEVDRSLTPWGRALHDYLRAYARWSSFAPWTWYMRRVWLPLKPSARRIVYVLWIVALFEMATLLVVLLVWWGARTG